MYQHYYSAIATVPFLGESCVYSPTYDVPSYINFSAVVDITYTVGSSAVVIMQYSNDALTWINSSAVTSALVGVFYYRYARMSITPTSCEGTVVLSLVFKR